MRLVLVVDIQHEEALDLGDVEVNDTQTASPAFASTRVGPAHLTQATTARHDAPALRRTGEEVLERRVRLIAPKVILHDLRKRSCLDEDGIHAEYRYYPTESDNAQGLVPGDRSVAPAGVGCT